MNERIKELAEQARIKDHWSIDEARYLTNRLDEQKFAELIIQECIAQVEQAKNSPFVSLDDAKRMSHFVDVTTKKIEKHFRY